MELRRVKIKTMEQMIADGYEPHGESLKINENFGFWMPEMEAALDESRIIWIGLDNTWTKDFCEYYIAPSMIKRAIDEGE